MSSHIDAEKFRTDGYLVIEDFADAASCDAMRAECARLVTDMDPADHHTTFSTTKQTFRDDYFINSADKIGFFFEEGALGSDAMHTLCPSFRKLTFCDKVKAVAKDIGLKDPVVPQSMYIFKQPNIGGEVVRHQDATYLYTEPLGGVVGLWLALEDATLENGCLWFVPGSHKAGLSGEYRMVRNPEATGPSCVYLGSKPDYDGEYVPVPIKKGSLILIDGLVYHKSERNLSDKSRHIYTFHMYDAGTRVWSDRNWLQPTEKKTFEHLYDVTV